MNEMHLGIVTVRDKDYHPNSRLIQAAQHKGHAVSLIDPYAWQPTIITQQLGVDGHADRFLPNIVMPRQGSEISELSLAFIRHLETIGLPMVNGFDTIVATRHQYYTLQTLCRNRIPVPDSIMIHSRDSLLKAVAALGGLPVVIKQVSQRQGSGICLVSTSDDIDQIVAQTLEKRRGLLVQAFIAPQGRTDIRALVIGNRMIAAMELIPAEGEFRANFHLGSYAKPFHADPGLQQLVLACAKAIDAEIAGIDLMIDRQQKVFVIEVNYSPGFKGLESATGLDIASEMIDFAFQKFQKMHKGTLI